MAADAFEAAMPTRQYIIISPCIEILRYLAFIFAALHGKYFVIKYAPSTYCELVTLSTKHEMSCFHILAIVADARY